MSIKVLIIEDDEAISETLKILLESKGYEAGLVEDGDRGLEKIMELRPDLVVLDLYLPGKSGLEIYLEMRENEETADIPVIFLSSLTKSQIKVTLGDSADIIPESSIFSKPIAPNALISRIEEELSGIGVD